VVVETRRPQWDKWTVNGLTAYKLLTTLSASPNYSVDYWITSNIRFGIRVWKRDSTGVETEITPGTPVAIVQRNITPTGWQQQSATWACPQTALATTDAIKVVWYVSSDGGAWAIVLEVGYLDYYITITEQLGDTQLDATTWTVRYRTFVWYDPIDDMYYVRCQLAEDIEDYSEIENFSHSTGVPPVVAQPVGDGLTWVQKARNNQYRSRERKRERESIHPRSYLNRSRPVAGL